MYRLFLFITTTALVATTATGCIEGPEVPTFPGDFQHPVASETHTDSEAGTFCDETQAHLDCALSCERVRSCDAMTEVVPEDLSECIWSCTVALLSAEEVAVYTTECLMASEGDCAQVHACMGTEPPPEGPAADEDGFEEAGTVDAGPDAHPEDTSPECVSNADCPEDAQCDENGTCQHVSQTSVVNVMECESACDALDACDGIQFAGGSFHLCFTQCLSMSSQPEVVNSVLCILGASSCEEVVECSGAELPDQDVPDIDGIDPNHPMAPVCASACDQVISCAPGGLDLESCIQLCVATSLTPEGQDQISCLFGADGCDEVFQCVDGGQEPETSEPETTEPECAEGDVSGACGECFCEDGAWICDECDEATEEAPPVSVAPVPAICTQACTNIDACDLSHHYGGSFEACTSSCAENLGKDGVIEVFQCVLSGDLQCDVIAQCNQEQPDCPDDDCTSGAPHEMTCMMACDEVMACTGEDFVDDDGQTCAQRCANEFFSPEVQDTISCVFSSDDCTQVAACVTTGVDFAAQPETGYEDEAPGQDDGFTHDDGDGTPDEEPVEETPGNDHPCFGPEPAPAMECGDIDIARELMVTDLSVVNDPTRTFDGCTGTPMGAWTFGNLMTKMAGDTDASAFVMNWLQQWTVDQELNGFVAPARQSIQSQVIDPWLARSGGETLDMALAPFRLLAIVNRVDLRNANEGDPGFSAGEGRFVFGLVNPDAGCAPREFVIILEYGQKADTLEDIQAWAQVWHGLGGQEFGEDYNQALEEVTELFAGAGMDPDKPNGSSINQIRTNEVALNGPWELREFRIQTDGHLAQVSVKQEPGADLRETEELAQWINANEGDVLNSTHSVPAEMLGPAAPVEGLWAPHGVDNPDARHAFGLNTCSGCHQSETGTPFLHVSNRGQDFETQLSGFLVGIEATDPVSGDAREFNDLERRMLDLCNLVSPHATAADVVDVDPAPACAP